MIVEIIKINVFIEPLVSFVSSKKWKLNKVKWQIPYICPIDVRSALI